MSAFTDQGTATIQINAWIDEVVVPSQKRAVDVNRASSAPKCVRARWYKAHGYEGEALTARTMRVFRMGDFIELEMVHYIKNACVGVGKLYSEVDFGTPEQMFELKGTRYTIYGQEDLEFILRDGTKITAHPDGWGKRNVDGLWELIEIKSSAERGFIRFEQGETPDYIKQVHAVMLTGKSRERNVMSARFFYYNKNTSHLFDRRYDYNREIAEIVVNEYYLAKGEMIPNIPIELQVTPNKKGEMKLPWQCSYCEFTTECRPEFKLTIEKGKPKYLKENES